MRKTKRVKGTKIMAMADRAGLPISVHLESASPHEVILIAATLAARFTTDKPQRLIGDRVYDSDPLDVQHRSEGIEMIAFAPEKPQETCHAGWAKVEEI